MAIEIKLPNPGGAGGMSPEEVDQHLGIDRTAGSETKALTQKGTFEDFSVDGIVEITYEDLVQLRDNSELVPGTYYRITDYQTKVKTNIDYCRNKGVQFDILVLAGINNHLYKDAKILPSENDESGFWNDNLYEASIEYSLTEMYVGEYSKKYINGDLYKGVINKVTLHNKNEFNYDVFSLEYKVNDEWYSIDYFKHENVKFKTTKGEIPAFISINNAITLRDGEIYLPFLYTSTPYYKVVLDIEEGGNPAPVYSSFILRVENGATLNIKLSDLEITRVIPNNISLTKALPGSDEFKRIISKQETGYPQQVVCLYIDKNTLLPGVKKYDDSDWVNI